MTQHLHGHHILRQRTKRVCVTTGCDNKPEPKDAYCVQCQLDGKAPDQVTSRGGVAASMAPLSGADPGSSPGSASARGGR